MEDSDSDSDHDSSSADESDRNLPADPLQEDAESLNSADDVDNADDNEIFDTGS